LIQSSVRARYGSSKKTGKPIAQVAGELGINGGTLGNWVAPDRAARDGSEEVAESERVIASQKAEHRVPHGISCRALGVSRSWLYKWRDRPPTRRQRRQAELDAAVAGVFARHEGRDGSPRVHADLLDEGWRVSVNTVAASMSRQGLQTRQERRRRGLTRADKRARTFPAGTGRTDQRVRNR
jgi:hypothetical protein